MLNTEVKIGDANAAVSAFGALCRLSGSNKTPASQSEFSARLSRMGGRARPLATALNKYIEKHGFDVFRSAVDAGKVGSVPSAAKTQCADAEAAAMVSVINFEELDRTALTFASSGLY